MAKLNLGKVVGPKGEAFTFSDFTPEQLASLKGPKGDPGADSTVPGPKGDPGDAYILTNDDKQEIAEIVVELLPDADEVSY